VLNWLQQFSTFCFLDNQQYAIVPHQYECLVAAGVNSFIGGEDLNKLNEFLQKKSWAFGHLAYSLSSSIHHFGSHKKDNIGFQPYYFFSPKIILEIKNNGVSVHAENPEEIFKAICTEAVIDNDDTSSSVITTSVLSKEDYIKKIQALQNHIHRGDCYEINFCQESFAEDADLNPFAAYQKLVAISPNPFSAFYRLRDNYLLCASPERFLQKKGNRILSQPIKGTIKRNVENNKEDELLKEELRRSQKDQSENVMVVDLVRNDLTRICNEASVKVDELYGIYSYPQVHQMISTISGELKDYISFSQIIKATFPMGSMTGAPKHRVMQLIEEYEPSARGIFSGAVGYINPKGDFDFNVVIRSLMYNARSRYLSYQVGSGITFYSDAEKEWEECLLKAEAIKKVLEGKMIDGG
jgi:para-aminobenzoate synthetase component 1